jgi:hypothetical protein
MTAESGTMFNQPATTAGKERTGCGKKCIAPGSPYTFHYGKLGERYAQDNTRRLYEVIGSHSLTLCSDCIGRYHNGHILRWGLATLALLSVVIAGLVFSELSPLIGIVAFVSFLGMLLSGGVLVGLILRDRQTRGEELAITLGKSDLERQGFDLFWHSDDHRLLERKRSS